MKLKSFRLRNYKGHLDTGELQVGSQFTVFIGQNNSGKSSLLEALSLISSFGDYPHLLPQTGAFPPIPNPSSEISLGVTLSGPELEHEILSSHQQVSIPVPHGSDMSSGQEYVSQLFALGHLSFEIVRRSSGWSSAIFPSHGLFEGSPNSTLAAVVNVHADRRGWDLKQLLGGMDSLPAAVGNAFQRKIYGFKAERMNISRSGISESPELVSDARNLPSVLLHLNTVPDASDQYINFLRQVFPTIYSVGSRPITQMEAQIEVITSYDAEGALRPGIIVPLSECGTGVSQVMALLYVVVTATSPRIIVIDEPNSFLHPGAAKKLVSILRQSRHQYIISTHSADLIRAIDPEVLHLIGWKKTASSFESIDRTSIHDQRKLLADLGVSLSDVFGADRILWVEGPTEERCFPLILDHLGLSSPSIFIASLVAVDDLTGKSRRAELSWDIYQKLSNGTALIPSALAFSFDRDGRTDRNIADMERASKGLARFLPRRMYENYLIHPRAIADLLSKKLEQPIDEHQVFEWLNNNAPGWSDENVDAATLLASLFTAMSDAKLEYRKTEHSLTLTQFILANAPEHVSELLDYCKRLVAPPEGG